MPVPEHVFLSHSSVDTEVAERLRGTLEATGIPVWIDSSKLTPGTADWEVTIRDAIERSYALIVLASPDACISKFVRAEIELATAASRRVFPVWIRGERWAECVPLHLMSAQYVDLRRFDPQALRILTDAIEHTVSDLTPAHYLVEPLWLHDGAGSYYHQSREASRRGYASIELPRIDNFDRRRPPSDGGRAVLFHLASFSSITELLDTLFENYLTAYFQPYTYGKDWLLREDAHFACGRVLASWGWLTSRLSGEPFSDNRHYRTVTPGAAGFREHSDWFISKTDSFKPIGLAVKDPAILEAICARGKALYALREAGVLGTVPVMEVASSLTHRYVLYFEHDWKGDLETERALVQVGEDAGELSFWITSGRPTPR